MENTPRAQHVCIKYGSRATMLLFYTLAFLVTCRIVKVVYGGGLSSFFPFFFCCKLCFLSFVHEHLSFWVSFAVASRSSDFFGGQTNVGFGRIGNT